jgi:predicted AlkP superfamily phosphohydrolase/phosphomutase
VLTRLLIIGLDAMDKDLIQRWAAAGKLPAFRRILEQSIWGETKNPIGLEAGGVWPGFYTGVSPARHGMYYAFLRFVAENYEQRIFRQDDFTAETFWDRLSSEGLRFAVFDAPYTFRSEKINGVHVVDWGTHAPMEWPHTGVNAFKTTPVDLAGEIEQGFGRDHIGNDDFVKLRTVDDYRGFRQDLIDRIKNKTDIARHLLGRGGWDCVLTVFHEAHAIGHRCWHLHDSSHPLYDPAIREAVGDPLEDVYIALDRAVATLLEDVGPQTNTLLFASHGMGPNYTATRLLDQILLRIEGFEIPQRRQSVMRALHQVWDWTPRPLQEVLAPARAKIWQNGIKRHFIEADRSKRKCFEVTNNGATGGIRLNVIGREPRGLVRPGEEFDALCQLLSEDLLSIVDVVSGKPLVKRVIKTADAYCGPRLPDLPDLLIDWNREAPISRIRSPKIGTMEQVYQLNRTGDHRPRGAFFATGPAFGPRRLNELTSVNDFAPTIARLLGTSLAGTDGVPIAALARPTSF